MAIRDADLKKLYGLSSGRCNICKIDLFENQVHIGEMAHVIAKKKKGARGNTEVTGDINGYENLILLCCNHHSEVDQNPDRYTIEYLHQLKNDHENMARRTFVNDHGREDDIASLKYIMKYVPFTRLFQCVHHLPRTFDALFFESVEVMALLSGDRPHGYPFRNLELQHVYDEYLSSCATLCAALNSNINGKNCFAVDMQENRLIGRTNRDLTYDERQLVDKEVSAARDAFLPAYSTLIQYLRTQYPEVALNVYSG